MILSLLASSFWSKVFPKDSSGKFHFMPQVSSVIIITLILFVLLMILGAKLKKVDPNKKTPIWLVPFVMIVEIINNFTKTNIGKRWKPYACYFTALACFMFILNISSIFGFTTPTSYIIINLAFGLLTFFIVQITGIRSLGFKGYINGLLGEVKALSPIMLIMNIVSELALPLSLTIRLTGNIISGSILNKILVGVLGWKSVVALPFLSAYFDIVSGLIQTTVFLMLSIINTSNKIHESEKIY